MLTKERPKQIYSNIHQYIEIKENIFNQISLSSSFSLVRVFSKVAKVSFFERTVTLKEFAFVSSDRSASFSAAML